MSGLPDVTMLTVAAVSKKLGVSKMTVYRRIEARELRAYRVGRQLRLDPRDVVAYMRGADTTADVPYGGVG